MTDIAQTLLEEIERVFTNKKNTDKILGEVYWKIQDGKATYEDAAKYANRLGELLAESIKLRVSPENLPDGRLYFEIAEKVIGPLLENNYELIADVAAIVQEKLNVAAGIHLKAVRPEMNSDRIKGIIEKVSSADDYEKVSWVLNEPVVNFSRSVVDDSIRENVNFHGRAGLSPTVTRIAEGGCCKWCSQLAGKYDYPVDREVYRRHNYCRCIVLYDPGNGKVQNVHSKVVYANQAQAERDARIERAKELRRTAEQREFTEKLKNHPKLFSTYSPESLKRELEARGFDVKPLSHGSLKGTTFEEGGGFKINFQGDGLLQYHPETKSHHFGAYYKISDNKHGIRWFDMNGDEIDVEATRSAREQIIKHS